VEVYFDDLGWIPFDPTPIDTERAVELPWAPRPADQEVLERPTDVPTGPTPAPVLPAPQVDRLPEAAPQGQTAPQDTSAARPVLVALGVLLGLGALLAAPAAARTLQRRRRLADGGPAALWDELAATARDLGLPWNPAHTLRQQAAALVRTVDGAGAGGGAHRAGASGAADAIERLARAEEAASYGRSGAAGDPALTAALTTARRGLTAAVPPRVRLRALLWPASLGDAVSAAVPARLPRRRRPA
jgi:hypothetical protein